MYMARTIKEIPAEEADRICKDVQLYFTRKDEWIWWEDDSPQAYRDGITSIPSTWKNLVFGVEVELDKPEYTTEHLRCDHG